MHKCGDNSKVDQAISDQQVVLKSFISVEHRVKTVFQKKALCIDFSSSKFEKFQKVVP